MKVRRLLLTTIANILPLMSRTVPCKINSGMDRHLLPLEQVEGTPPVSAARITLRNGSLRPKAPPRGGVFFSGVAAATVAGGVLPAGLAGVAGLAFDVAVTGALLIGLAALVAAVLPVAVLPAGVVVFVATGAGPVLCAGAKVPVTTEGLEAVTFPLLLEVAPVELLEVVWAALPGPIVGGVLVTAPVLLVADGAGLTVLPLETVFWFVVDCEVVTGVLPAVAGVADGGVCAFPVVTAGLAGVACVLAGGVACACPVAAEGLTGVAPVLADGVGVGDGLFPAAWPLELVLCAVAMVTMNVASARIRISFISVPFVCGLTTNPPYFFTGTAGWPGLGGPAAAAGTVSWS